MLLPGPAQAEWPLAKCLELEGLWMWGFPEFAMFHTCNVLVSQC